MSIKQCKSTEEWLILISFHRIQRWHSAVCVCVLQQGGPPMYPPYGPAAAAGPYGVPYHQHFPPAPPPHHHHRPGMGPVAGGPHHLHHPMMHGPPGAAVGAQPPPGVGVPHHHHQCNSHSHHVHAPAGTWISALSAAATCVAWLLITFAIDSLLIFTNVTQS